jgi:hypothetical protein
MWVNLDCFRHIHSHTQVSQPLGIRAGTERAIPRRRALAAGSLARRPRRHIDQSGSAPAWWGIRQRRRGGTTGSRSVPRWGRPTWRPRHTGDGRGSRGWEGGSRRALASSLPICAGLEAARTSSWGASSAAGRPTSRRAALGPVVIEVRTSSSSFSKSKWIQAHDWSLQVPQISKIKVFP